MVIYRGQMGFVTYRSLQRQSIPTRYTLAW